MNMDIFKQMFAEYDSHSETEEYDDGFPNNRARSEYDIEAIKHSHSAHHHDFDISPLSSAPNIRVKPPNLRQRSRSWNQRDHLYFHNKSNRSIDTRVELSSIQSEGMHENENKELKENDINITIPGNNNDNNNGNDNHFEMRLLTDMEDTENTDSVSIKSDESLTGTESRNTESDNDYNSKRNLRITAKTHKKTSNKGGGKKGGKFAKKKPKKSSSSKRIANKYTIKNVGNDKKEEKEKEIKDDLDDVLNKSFSLSSKFKKNGDFDDNDNNLPNTNLGERVNETRSTKKDNDDNNDDDGGHDFDNLINKSFTGSRSKIRNDGNNEEEMSLHPEENESLYNVSNLSEYLKQSHDTIDVNAIMNDNIDMDEQQRAHVD